MLACAARMGSACSLRCPILMVLQVLFQEIAGLGLHKLVMGAPWVLAHGFCLSALYMGYGTSGPQLMLQANYMWHCAGAVLPVCAAKGVE